MEVDKESAILYSNIREYIWIKRHFNRNMKPVREMAKQNMQVKKRKKEKSMGSAGETAGANSLSGSVLGMS